MNLRPVLTPRDWQTFFRLPGQVYRYYPQYRGTDTDIAEQLLHRPSAFKIHAEIHPYLILHGPDCIGRFALIHDRYKPEIVQLAFWEAFEEAVEVLPHILMLAKKLFPFCSSLVAGINGHLNASAGFLTDGFERPPLFGLPYTAPYYPNLFRDWTAHRMQSMRFPIGAFSEHLPEIASRTDLSNIRIRSVDLDDFRSEMALYTVLNNTAFATHPFWADRLPDEDLELFQPFRPLMNKENLLFAFVDGRPAGFLLWYPDFNELVSGRGRLSLLHLIRYRFFNPISTFRLTQIAVLPEFCHKPVGLALLMACLNAVRRSGYCICEAGFVFDDNQSSLNLVNRMLHRTCIEESTIRRHYAVYQTSLRQ